MGKVLHIVGSREGDLARPGEVEVTVRFNMSDPLALIEVVVTPDDNDPAIYVQLLCSTLVRLDSHVRDFYIEHLEAGGGIVEEMKERPV